LGWIGSKESNLSKGFSRKGARLKSGSNYFPDFAGGSSAKLPSSSSGHRGTGHGQELLSIGGAGGTGDEEAEEGLKPDEGDMGNCVGYSPSVETKGTGRKFRSTPAGSCCSAARVKQQGAAALQLQGEAAHAGEQGVGGRRRRG
jgi:hypothetical protein